MCASVCPKIKAVREDNERQSKICKYTSARYLDNSDSSKDITLSARPNISQPMNAPSGSARPVIAAYKNALNLLFVPTWIGKATAKPSGMLCSPIAQATPRPTVWFDDKAAANVRSPSGMLWRVSASAVKTPISVIRPTSVSNFNCA